LSSSFLREKGTCPNKATSTGIPKIIDAMQANGSPPAEFDFDEDHSYFMVRLPVHPAALEVADSEVGELADMNTPQVTPQASRLLEVLKGTGVRDYGR